MDSFTETLPDDIPLLKEIIVGLKARIEGTEKNMSLLLEEIRLLRAGIFGRRSEKTLHDSGAQLLLFDELPEPEEEEDAIAVPAHTRRKSGRKPLPDHLSRIEVVHDISDTDKLCACGCEKSRIGEEEVSEQLDVIPAQMQVLRHIRPKYACRNCEGVEDNGPTVAIAPVPEQIIPKSMASPGLLAYILTAKFVDALPFYRQEKIFVRRGVELSRASMCTWAMKVAERCGPLLELFQQELFSGPLIQLDETTVQVLSEAGSLTHIQIIHVGVSWWRTIPSHHRVPISSHPGG